MPVQSRLVTVGVSEQSAKDSFSGTANYKHGLTGGNIMALEWEESDLPVTWDTRVHADRERLSVTPAAELEFVALSQSIGQWLKLILGNISTTGTDPYTHTFTVADDLPYATIFGQYGTEFYQIRNAKVNEATLSWDRTGAMRATVSLMGTELSFDDTSAFTSNNDERSTDGYMRAQGGTLTVDGETDLRITSGSVTLTNAASPVFDSTKVIPDDVFEGVMGLSFSLTAMPDDLDDWRKFLTGSTSGTDIQGDPYTGAVNLDFGSSSDPGHSLTFDSSNAVFTAEFPGADPSGGPAELAIEGVILGDTNTDAVTIDLVNDVTDYSAV